MSSATNTEAEPSSGVDELHVNDPLDLFSESETPPFAVLNDGAGHRDDPMMSRQGMDTPVRKFKKQAIQKVLFAGGWLAASRANDVSSGFLKTYMTLAIPQSNPDDILAVTPSFRVDQFQAPVTIDIPSELYDTGLEFFYQKSIRDRLSFIGIFQPAIRSDFTTSDKALRLFGVALLTWDYRPDELSLSLGAVYLGRADIGVLPAVGLTWTPHSRFRMDLRFPESRLSWRIAKDGMDSETWSYLSAGFGGNTWAVTRQSGETDELSTRDIRIQCGIQHIVDGGGGWFIEAGLATGRTITYQSTDTDLSLSTGVLLQAGWAY